MGRRWALEPWGVRPMPSKGEARFFWGAMSMDFPEEPPHSVLCTAYGGSSVSLA